MVDETQRPFAARRLAPLALLILVGIMFMALGGHRYLTLAALADHGEWLGGIVKRNPAEAAVAFIAAYAGLVSLSVPGAALFTIAGGFLFGPWLGALYALVGATIGATVVFLAARAGL